MKLAALGLSVALVVFIPHFVRSGWEPLVRSVDEEASCQNTYSSDVCVKKSCSFKAAVFEYERVDKAKAKDTVQANLETFENVANVAGAHGVNILVFPEDGLFVGTKNYMEPVLEEVPDPMTLVNGNNPCEEPEKFHGLEILIRLSCAARNNSLYLIANYGTKQRCLPNPETPSCPENGLMALNTDLVFDPTGSFIRRYRKYNLFLENFDPSPSLETVYFDTPYGRFGVFTCFDMMFKDPAIKLVEEFGIDTAIFPTWWYDELPFLTAIQFQDAWSFAHRVNLLASNINRRRLGSAGSGIYSALESIYTNSSSLGSKLLIANVPMKHSTLIKPVCTEKFDSKVIEIVESKTTAEKYSNIRYDISKGIVITLENPEEELTKCIGSFCCTIKYKLKVDMKIEDRDKLVMVMRNGNRPGLFPWYEQNCMLVSLAERFDYNSPEKIEYSKYFGFKFERLLISGVFNTPYVYPIASYDIDRLVDRKDRNFSCVPVGWPEDTSLTSCHMNYTSKPDENETLTSFVLYGRQYEKDLARSS